MKEFLSDKKVIQISRFKWLPILFGIILPFRSPKSAKLYQRIWTPDGSPLLVTSIRIEHTLQNHFDNNPKILSCMRYGSPSIESKLEELTDAGCNEIFCLPMFPQYSETTTGSIIEKLQQLKNEYITSPNIYLMKDYSENKNYIDSLANHLSNYYNKDSDEHLIISFHGIPTSYVSKGDPYQEHCQKTTDLLIKALELNNSQYTLTYQSRFGPEEWLQPYTDKKIEELSTAHIKVAVFCPGFLIDCLETLDEMGNEAKKLYDSAGGPSFRFIPCLNDSPELIETLKSLYQNSELFESL